MSSPSSATPSAPLAQVLVEGLCPFAVCLDNKGNLSLTSKQTARMLGMSQAELATVKLLDLLDAASAENLQAAIEASTRTGEVQATRLAVAAWDSSTIHLQVQVFPDPMNKARTWVSGFDISELVTETERLRKLATHDPLTGLPNRTLAMERAQWKLAQAKRARESMTVLIMDLDGFKKVNDSLGHTAGDELLKMAAARLRPVFRASDTLARLGGDEFCALLPGCGSQSELDLISTRISNALGEAFHLAGQTVYISTTLGASVYPQSGEDVETLLKHADVALYQAKAAGGKRLVVHTPGASLKPEHNVSLESAMYDGISRGEFFLAYQPIVRHGGEVAGFETLMRWKRADGSITSPALFIPLAESNGLINLLGTWALRSSLMQLARFDEQGLGHLYASVNVSLRQLQSPKFLQTVELALKAARVEPHRLTLEVTESMLMEDQQKVLGILRDLRALGVGVSLDDFGTGYSSLSYLQDIPLTVLKVDRSFVQSMSDKPNSRAIAKLIVEFARSLGLRSVAEGVETQAQADELAAMGVSYLQGFHFSKPLSPADFEAKYGKTLSIR